MIDTTNIWDILTSQVVLRVVFIALGLIAILFINGIIKKGLNRSITDIDRKYRARKAVNLLAYAAMVIVVLFVYADRLGNLGVALGVAGAGIAFALQEVIVSFAGWLNIMITGLVNVGQRIKIGDVCGDIIDIGVLNTTIMETGDWVSGDLYNGRIVTISNSFVYKGNVHNYSAEYPFLWDELTVPIRQESNHKLARELFNDVLLEICGDYAKASAEEWRRLTNKYRVEDAQVSPMVSMVFDEKWITFTLRYIVDYKKRRTTKDLIFTRLLEVIKENHDQINIATSTSEVTTYLGDDNQS